jgi:hypothetical protein
VYSEVRLSTQSGEGIDFSPHSQVRASSPLPKVRQALREIVSIRLVLGDPAWIHDVFLDLSDENEENKEYDYTWELGSRPTSLA